MRDGAAACLSVDPQHKRQVARRIATQQKNIPKNAACATRAESGRRKEQQRAATTINLEQQQSVLLFVLGISLAVVGHRHCHKIVSVHGCWCDYILNWRDDG
jgi:hypothetical protein